jgi:GNAT superfamily N-acetyltransferase
MTEADLAAAAYVRKEALESLERSEGREPEPWAPAPHGNTLNHVIRTDPEGSWAAEMRGVVVGYAQAIVRGDIWFLAQLFVQPAMHGLGIGQELLQRARDYGRAKQARVFSVVSSTSPVAQSLYMRNGMFAFGIGYRLSGPVEALLALPEPQGNTKRVVDCKSWQDRIAELDRYAFGAERRQDHAFYLADDSFPGAQTSFGLNRDGELVGYGYAGEPGWISPIVAYDPNDQLPLLRMAADWLTAHEVVQGNVWVLSLNHIVLSALLRSGWRVHRWSFLLGSEPFGKFDRYHPSGGILL